MIDFERHITVESIHTAVIECIHCGIKRTYDSSERDEAVALLETDLQTNANWKIVHGSPVCRKCFLRRL